MTQTNNIMKASELIRIRVWAVDFDGTKSERTAVQYVESLEEAAKSGWKYELA